MEKEGAPFMDLRSLLGRNGNDVLLCGSDFHLSTYLNLILLCLLLLFA